MSDLGDDFQENGAQLLLIASSSEAAKELENLAARRMCVCQRVNSFSEATNTAGSRLFDLLIIEASNPLPPIREYLELLGQDPTLSLLPTLLIHPEVKAREEVESEVLRLNVPASVSLLSSPFSAAEFLTKLSVFLRSRGQQKEQLRLVSRLCSSNANLRELATRISLELEEAQAVQNALLPQWLPSARDSAFAACFAPLEAVGGDFYDIWKISDELIGLFIADVSGHGLSAALLGTMTKMALSYAPKDNPGQMFESINRKICEIIPEGRFITATAVFYRPETAEIEMVRAGHPPALYYSRISEKVELLAPPGMPFGLNPEAGFTIEYRKMVSKDRLILLTDGVTETSNLSGEQLGIQRLAGYLRSLSPDLSIDAVLSELISRQQGFSQGRLIKDDVTFVGLQRL